MPSETSIEEQLGNLPPERLTPRDQEPSGDVFQIVENLTADPNEQVTIYAMVLSVSLGLASGAQQPIPHEVDVSGVCVHEAARQIYARLSRVEFEDNRPPDTAIEILLDRMVPEARPLKLFRNTFEQRADYLHNFLQPDDRQSPRQSIHIKTLTQFDKMIRTSCDKLVYEDLCRQLAQDGQIDPQKYPATLVWHILSQRFYQQAINKVSATNPESNDPIDAALRDLYLAVRQEVRRTSQPVYDSRLRAAEAIIDLTSR